MDCLSVTYVFDGATVWSDYPFVRWHVRIRKGTVLDYTTYNSKANKTASLQMATRFLNRALK